MIILGIETSCDETALALYDLERGLLGHILHSQINQLSKYGGIIPEVAARYHVQYLTPLLTNLLHKLNLHLKDINFIAYTKGPGLVGSLLTGISFAKSLGFALKIPTLGIHHLEGHLLACFIKEHNTNTSIIAPKFPFLALLASGGHTMLIQANSLGNYKILGETLDDAAGEALDKTAKLLKLSPPNGKSLSILAEQASEKNSSILAKSEQASGVPKFTFPRPLANQNNLNFSFSGLKTAAMLQIKKLDNNNHATTNTNTCNDNYDVYNQKMKANLAYAFQQAVMDSLVTKCKQALITTKLNRLVIAGGVSANKYLREQLLLLEKELLLKEQFNKPAIEIFFPKLEFCTDNAAMIAIAGAMRFIQGLSDQNLYIEALARWDLESIAF